MDSPSQVILVTPEDLATLAKLDGRINELEQRLTHYKGELYRADEGLELRPIVVKYGMEDVIEHWTRILNELQEERDALLYH